jgi:hypothetical protein
MKTLKIIIILFVVSILKVNAQSSVILKVEDIWANSDSLFLQFSIANKGDQLIKIYKPERQDICCGIVKILLTNNVGEKSQIIPCVEIIDLDAINLNCKNSFYLFRDEKLFKEYRFSLKDVVPFLTKNTSYSVQMEIYLKDAPFEGEINDIYKQDLKSKNEVKLKL